MKRALSALLLLFLLGAPRAEASSDAPEGPIQWNDWSPDLFERARREDRFVLLDLEAVWCHWCHVMAETTYRDPKVVELIGAKYIAVRVDQDNDPALSVRYEEWGWPATILFAPDGTELVKRRGYIPPEAMASLLQAVIDDPTPGPSVRPETAVTPGRGALGDQARAKLERAHADAYDVEYGGWGGGHKLLDWASVEYAIERARSGDAEEASRARRTLDEALNLLDPVWGGFYQYSDERDWKSPHYEKIMSVQAQYLRAYSRAWSVWKEPSYLEAARRTAGYVAEFWTSPEGAFYTSQDADIDRTTTGKVFYALDDAGRRALGRAPRIDRHVYARENGWMISALCALSDASGDAAPLEAALRAAERMLVDRPLEGDAGGFRHDEKDEAGPYLGDTLAMGQAFLDLYASTADRRWLERSERAAAFAFERFAHEDGAGYFTAPPPPGAVGAFARPVRQIEENAACARWADQLFHYTGREGYREAARRAMRYLGSSAVLDERRYLTAVLLADLQMGSDPAHLTIVGSKSDPAAAALFRAARAFPAAYRRIEWWDPSEGPLPRADVEYPEMERPAAFVCVDGACSTPFYDETQLSRGIARLLGARSA